MFKKSFGIDSTNSHGFVQSINIGYLNYSLKWSANNRGINRFNAKHCNFQKVCELEFCTYHHRPALPIQRQAADYWNCATSQLGSAYLPHRWSKQTMRQCGTNVWSKQKFMLWKLSSSIKGHRLLRVDQRGRQMSLNPRSTIVICT